MTEMDTQTSFLMNHSSDTQTSQTELSTAQSLSNDPLLKEDYSISQLMERTKKNELPEKVFLVDGKFHY